MDRRRFLTTAGAVSAATLLPGLRRPSFAQSNPDQLTIMTWGGNFGDALQRGAERLYHEATGVQVVQDRGSSPVQRIAKLKASLNNQSFDIVQLHDGLFPLAESQGVLEPLDRDSPRLSHLQEIYPEFIHDNWVAFIYSAIGIAYNSDEISTPPTSFADLWNPQYAGRIVIPEISHSIGNYIIPIGAMAVGQPPNDAEAGFEQFSELVELDPIFARDTDSIVNAFASGEALIGLLYKSQTMAVTARNPAVKWVFPSEGAISISWGTGIAKNTPNREAAEEFLNYTLTPESQIEYTKAFNYPGTNKGALDMLDAQTREAIQLTEEERSRLVNFDHQFLSETRAEWTDRWNRVVSGG